MIITKKNFFCGPLIAICLMLFSFKSSAQDTCDFLIQLDPDINLNLGDSVQLSLAVSVPLFSIESVQWTPDNALSCNDCLEPFASPSEDICYTAIVTDTTGCSESDTICIFVQTLALKNLDRSESIDLFPNPPDDFLNITSEIYELSEIKIFNAQGQLVRLISKPNKRFQYISVPELDTGVYFLEVDLGKYFARKKFVKF